jgi:hypothetical protein
MRSLIRKRTLAALCALLLAFASLANANAPARPIDRPEGPPELDPTMVGDPDQPGGNVTIVVGQWIYVGRVPGVLGAQLSKIMSGRQKPFRRNSSGKPGRGHLGR